MVFSFLYLAVRALLGLFVRCRRGPDVKDVELLVLRHEIAVLRRQVGRPKLRLADRALFAAAACHLSPASRLSLLVSPRTLLRWHQSLVRWKRRRCGTRPGRRSSQLRSASLCCGSHERTRVGGTAGSAANLRSLVSRPRQPVSAACLPARGWAPRPSRAHKRPVPADAKP